MFFCCCIDCCTFSFNYIIYIFICFCCYQWYKLYFDSIPKYKFVHTNFAALVANREENTLNNIFLMQISVKYGNTNNLKIETTYLVNGMILQKLTKYYYIARSERLFFLFVSSRMSYCSYSITAEMIHICCQLFTQTVAVIHFSNKN